MDFALQLARMRDNFEKNRPESIALPRPGWMDRDEGLSRLYEEKELLLREGRVVYSYLLQANEILFKRFPPFDYPAQILYTVDPLAEADPFIMRPIAQKLLSYKGNTAVPPEGIRNPVESVRCECDRSVYELYLLRGESEDEIPVRMLTAMVFRRHLPGGVLRGEVTPIIVCHDVADSVLILPKAYWTEEFTRYWLGK